MGYRDTEDLHGIEKGCVYLLGGGILALILGGLALFVLFAIDDEKFMNVLKEFLF